MIIANQRDSSIHSVLIRDPVKQEACISHHLLSCWIQVKCGTLNAFAIFKFFAPISIADTSPHAFRYFCKHYAAANLLKI